MFSPESGGFLINLRDYHTKEDIAAAVFAGLCSETKYLSARISNASSQPITCIHAAGGPSKSAYFMQLKADMMGCDVVLAEESEASCLGAAILSAIGAGDIGFDQIDKMASGSKKTYRPMENAMAEKYYEMYEKNRNYLLAMNG